MVGGVGSIYELLGLTSQRHSKEGAGGAGCTRRHLLGGGKLAKIVKKLPEISHCKFHTFASADD